MNKIKVSGTYQECGQQIGKYCRDGVNVLLEASKKSLIDDNLFGGDWQKAIEESQQYLPLSRQICPEVVKELTGVSQGAGISFNDLWACVVEEIYIKPADRCTDIILDQTLTESGMVIGHNNDFTLASEKNLTLVDWNIDNFGRLITIGDSGFYVGVGLNEYGVILSGNTVTPNDIKLGVPRYIMCRQILNQKNIKDALEVATHPQRAASYNNIVLDGSSCFDIEASATDYALLKLHNGFLIHTNHYTDPKMEKFEGLDKTKASYTSSINRYESAKKQCEQLLSEKPNPQEFVIRVLVSHDHGESNLSICRHSNNIKTNYSFIYDTTKPYIEIASGNPCQNPYEKYPIAWK